MIAVLYRTAAQQEKLHNVPDRQWIYFDGPGDAPPARCGTRLARDR